MSSFFQQLKISFAGNTFGSHNISWTTNKIRKRQAHSFTSYDISLTSDWSRLLLYQWSKQLSVSVTSSRLYQSTSRYAGPTWGILGQHWTSFDPMCSTLRGLCLSSASWVESSSLTTVRDTIVKNTKQSADFVIIICLSSAKTRGNVCNLGPLISQCYDTVCVWSCTWWDKEFTQRLTFSKKAFSCGQQSKYI